MRSSLQTRRRSLRPVLALLGVAGTVATLPLAPRAGAIGGGVAPVSQPTSPRETTGATPSVSLFQTSASSYTGGGGGGGAGSGNTTSSEITSRGSASSGRDTGGGAEDRPSPSRRRRAAAADRGGEEEERTESAGRRRTAARREREESRPARQRETTAVASSGGGKATVESKDKAIVAPPPKDRPIFTAASGWESRYIYHGLDIIGFNSKQRFLRGFGLSQNGDIVPIFKDAPSQSSSIWYANLGAEFKGFRFKLDYVQAVDSTVPFLQGQPGTSSIPLFTVDANGNLRTPTRRRIYRELDPGASYTLGIANLFDVTAGYTFFLFPNDDFKGTHYQGETLVQITYKQLKYVKPSFIYYHYNSPFDDANIGDLNGSYVEFRLDGAVPLIDRPNFGLAIAPYVLGSYNINFLKFGGQQDVGGFNTFETGIKTPVRLGKHFTVTPYGNYGLNISGASEQVNSLYGGGQRHQFGEQTHFWGGVTVGYTF